MAATRLAFLGLSIMGQAMARARCQGETLKLVVNQVSVLNLMAAREEVQMGLSLGIPLELMETVMTLGSAQSFELANVFARLREENYAPGFSVSV